MTQQRTKVEKRKQKANLQSNRSKRENMTYDSAMIKWFTVINQLTLWGTEKSIKPFGLTPRKYGKFS